MASKSLAVKYRPQTFGDVTEQGEVITILKNQLVTQSIQHVYLFTGGAGTGKTTMARIFANEVNQGHGNPIEIDAASNNSVEDARALIQQAKTQAFDSEYKVFIVDECFPANTNVRTKNGQKHISDIVAGDIVESMSGNQVVTNVFKNSVLTDRLCCVTVNNRKIITTVEHLFFTNHGWIEASQLHKGDIVYGSEDLQKLWKRVCKTTGQRREVLLSQLFGRVCEENTQTENKNCPMPDMWQANDCSELFSEENLFKRVQKYSNFEVRKTLNEYRIWDGFTETIIRKNETEQSNVEAGKYSKDVEYQRKEWYSSPVAYSAGWQREIHTSSDSLVASIRDWLGIRVSNKHEKSELARTSTTLVLQSRPWLFSEKSSNRGRWCRTQMEKWIIKGCKKNERFGNVRVESVEIYKRGYNDKLFRDSFTDTELSSGYVTMYDLEVENDHSYFVEDILVHNCHMLSNSAWNALLKLLEEPPAKSIFIFCTTDPQKIPKTILSRVQRYDFQRISQSGITNRLADIIVSEKVPHADNDAVEYIAKIADGGMRDAITMLDKCLAYSNELTLSNVLTVLGAVNYDQMFALTDDIIDGKVTETLAIINEIYMSGKDLKQFIKNYLEFVLDVCKYGMAKSFAYVRIPSIYEKRLSGYSESDISRCVKLLDSLIKLSSEIKWNASPKSLIESVFVLECVNG